MNCFDAVAADDSMLPDLLDETPSPTYNEDEQIGLEDSDLVNDETTATATAVSSSNIHK
jgi:hypothetical protein